MSDFNPMINAIDIIQAYPGNLKLMRMKGKGNFFISARDFLVINHVIFDSKTGIIESISGSVEDPRCPPDKNFIRADTKIMGTRLAPMSDGKTYMLSIAMSDPKGSVPDMFKSSMSKKQASRSETINNAFKKRFKIK